MIDWLQNNKRTVAGVSLIYIAAAYYTGLPIPWEIPGAGIVLTGGVVAGLVGYFAADKIEALLPDPEGIYLVCFESSKETGGEIWELTEDQFDAMEIHGSLFEWPTGKRVYECKEYRPTDNVAVGNWRESAADSQLAGHCLVEDAMAEIAEIRNNLEPEVREKRHLQRQIRSVIRELERDRLEAQQEILDASTNPQFGDEKTVSQVIQDHMPDRLLPDSMKGDDLDEPQHNQNGHETLDFSLLDDSEALEPKQ